MRPSEDAERAARLRQRFLDLLEQHVAGLRIRGDRATGRCPCHNDRNPSFSADLARNVWYCFATNRGGGIKAFAALVGEDVSDLFRVGPPAPTRQADRVALATAKADFEAWCDEQAAQLRALIAALEEERAVLEIAYRHTHRHPEWYTPPEQDYWAHRLAATYDRLEMARYQLNRFLLPEWRREQILWFIEATNGQN